MTKTITLTFDFKADASSDEQFKKFLRFSLECMGQPFDCSITKLHSISIEDSNTQKGE